MFYYGNLVGNVSRGGGFGAGSLIVNPIDLSETRRSLYRYGAAGSASITHPTDHNRDGRVSGLDILAVRPNHFTSLWLIEPPPATAAALEP